jgi:ribosomal protein S18 acetylase RimI-like enzyme
MWSRRDPSVPHWHLGPVAVERHLQSQGIGSALLNDFCRRVDAARSTAYLETDKRQNVGFYERFGFRVVDEIDVLDVPNWFMLRDPAG